MKCGLYVAMFVYYISLYGIDQFACYMRTIYSKQKLSSNDKYVTRYYLTRLSKPPCSQ